jgi:hypothetical protein
VQLKALAGYGLKGQITMKGGNGQVRIHLNAMSSAGTITTSSLSSGSDYTVSGSVNSLVVGDINADGCVDNVDLSIFAEKFLYGCGSSSYTCNRFNCYCGGADINKDKCVNLQDFSSICQNWLKCEDNWE